MCGPTNNLCGPTQNMCGRTQNTNIEPVPMYKKDKIMNENHHKIQYIVYHCKQKRLIYQAITFDFPIAAWLDRKNISKLDDG